MLDLLEHGMMIAKNISYLSTHKTVMCVAGMMISLVGRQP